MNNEKQTQIKRNKLDCKFYKPRGKTTHYCTIDHKDPIKRCFGVCIDFIDVNK